MKDNTIKTSLKALGLASVFTATLMACDSQEPLSPEAQALFDEAMAEIETMQKRIKEDPVGFLVDELEKDMGNVVLSPKYGYYNPAFFAFSHEDSTNPKNSFKYATKVILGHDQDGQGWACSDDAFSNHYMTILPKSMDNDAEGAAYKIVFDLDDCEELPEGTIPRHPAGVLEA